MSLEFLKNKNLAINKVLIRLIELYEASSYIDFIN